VKNESSFEVIILRGVVLAFYRSEIFCEKKKLGFGLVVLKCPIFDGRVLGFVSKMDHGLFGPFGLFLPDGQLWGVPGVRFGFCLWIDPPYQDKKHNE